MAAIKNTPVCYRKFNLRDELKRAARCDGSSCEVCEGGKLLFLAASDLLELMKEDERRARRIRRARRVGNLIVFPKTV